MHQETKRVFRIVFLVAIIAIIVIAHTIGADSQPTGSQLGGAILIDPGHGGEDGGASAADGTLEKTINLAIALDLRDMLTLCGLSVEMTRDTDVSIYDMGCTTTRQMKVSDMHNRLKLYDEAAMTVSIHQNHFSVAKYCGTQVFYSSSHPMSARLATAVRERVIAHVQPSNTRELKQATDSIFLLYRTVKPAILVECGFLSNPQESGKLKETVYQQQMALAIATGLLDVYQPSKE